PGNLEFLARKQEGPALGARLYLDLPPLLEPGRRATDLPMGPGAETRPFALPVTPLSRGLARLRSATLETASPWGLWTLRRKVELDCALKVYPRLQAGSAQVALPEEAPQAGIHRRRQV